MAIVFPLIAIFLALIAVFVSRPKPRDLSSLPTPSPAVQALIHSGKKVAAIRAYRKQVGASLLEASRVIEHYAD
ncbi:hypothetical protein [Oleiagrimonas sp.]|jgi:hypothetical protein|uniref:hypothetical protein n=1 Tax=Oleiagrimonas sp. TaxID=2010330 RepID=UPI0026135659|nr:hypothetical protein [Oleiagrimonas sp.]MDA3914251.1 hypothetical protein [Oleiagrimonas sp.]